MCTGVTHIHVDIGCHVNLIGPTTLFGTQNEPCPKGCMSHDIPFGVTHFESKSAKSIFLIIYYFPIT
jgi:hypothetical protein